MPPLDRQMDSFERGKWCLWTLSLLTQSLFLIATQIFDAGSSIIWATGAAALVCVLALIILALFEQCSSTARQLGNSVLVGVVPAIGLTLLYWDDVTSTVPWAAFEALCAALMASWAIFDMLWLKPSSITVRFDDVVADAMRAESVQ